eukprot:8983583-Ditylum_brightwellii.AAC.1
MGRALEDSTLDTWEDRVAALCSSQVNTQPGYNKAKGEIIQKVLGPSAYKEQVRYLDKTKKPREMTSTETVQEGAGQAGGGRHHPILTSRRGREIRVG